MLQRNRPRAYAPARVRLMMDTVLHAFIALFVIVDPIGIAAIFLGLTSGSDAAYRKRTAVRGTVIATVVMFVFAFVGDYLFRALGVSLPAFSIAGGALLFLLAIDMVLVRRSGLRSTTVSEDHEAGSKEDISVFPLAIPLIAGPGALTSILLLMERAGHDGLLQAAIIGVMFAVMGMTFGILVFADVVRRVLGITGVNVVGRVLGIILAALAVQFILNGIRGSGIL
ncbi:MAG TPA: MarC family protein [Alphaproteobacteria bacterium]|jgi:multiple antibiotic resistance protein|nr:MarC family protein [Alphaproteobacteria bacterium]